MFKLLQRRAPSAAGWMHTDSKQLLIESIRARVLCLTSQRYASGKCPVGPLPCHLRAYQVFGYGIGFTEAGARLRFRRWVSEWRALAEGTADFGAMSRRFPLTDERLRGAISVGSFARLQILTDCIHILGRSYVRLPEDFGHGVKLDEGVMAAADVESLRQKLSSSGAFKRSFGGRPRIDQVAHLVCEVLQALMRSQRMPARQAFFCKAQQLLQQQGPPSGWCKQKASHYELATADAEAIAQYATR